jgi:uncharacterized protein (DUF885 family)
MTALAPLLVAATLLAGPAAPVAAPVAATTAAPVPATSPAASAEDQRFARFVSETLDAYWKLNPEWAFALGSYTYAATLPAPDAAWRRSLAAFHDRSLRTLATFSPKRLDTSNRVDLELLRRQLESERWSLQTFREWAWQPSQYNVGDGFARMLDVEYAPLPQRLRDVSARLALVPAYYAAARASLETPTLEHTQLAILQNQGALGVFGDDLLARVDGAPLEADEKATFRVRVAEARRAIEGHLAYLQALEGRLATGGARSFRIGKVLHDRKFALQGQSILTAEQLYRRALVEKASLLDQMELLARVLWPRHLPGQAMPQDRLQLIGAVIEALGRHHVAPDQLLPKVRSEVAALEVFVRERDLVDQDPTKPLTVRETPAYQRGVAGAGLDSPGPYDPGVRSYYNVTTPEAGDAESFLREYNDWMLQILDIHEAVPGHYVQAIHSNRNPSVVKTAFGSGAMVEGWAVYAQRMMLEAGWGDNAPELWLMELKMELRVVVNTILDREVHAGTLDRAGAIDLLRREAFQSEAEATEKWKRVTLTQTQLMTYFDGFAQIMALRGEERARLGPAFRLRAFHDRFLSYGSAPVKVIRSLMRE